MTLMTAGTARVASRRAMFGATPFFNEGRVATMLDLLGPLDGGGLTSVDDPRVAYEWNQRVMAASPSYTPQGPIDPWNIPGHYDDEAGSDAVLEKIDSDFHTAVDLALRWVALGDTAAADGCVNILTAWSTLSAWTPNSGSSVNNSLPWSDRWPILIQAAMMMRGYVGFTPTLESALQSVTLNGAHMSMAHRGNNNTGAWGVVWELAAATFLNDRPRFDRAIVRWQSIFDSGVVRNIPVDEVYREDAVQGNGKTGLWYSNFFLYALTVGAEWARFGGEWLYDYEGRDGSTFRGLADNVRYWTRFPSRFPFNTSPTPSRTFRILPHDDILHALWPTAESAWMLHTFKEGNDRDSIGVRGSVLAYRGRPLIG